MESVEAKKSLKKQLNGGVSSLVLLSLLQQSSRPMYGYEIAKELERRTGGSLPMASGALYPVLRSLEKKGLLKSHTELSEEDRARRYYKVTAAGGEVVEHWKSVWKDTKQFVDSILMRQEDDATSRKRDSALPKTTGTGSR